MDEVKRYYPVGAAAMLPCDTPLILAADHDRSRAQDREFTERLVVMLGVAGGTFADIGTTEHVSADTKQWARMRAKEIHALLTEWEKRNETA